MLYALLIYEAEAVATGYSDDEMEAHLDGHRKLQEDAKRRGVFVEANQLMPPRDGRAVRVRAATPQVTDGPFVETKELLVGYYVLDCKDFDEAVALASRIPNAQTGGVEIRPVAYFERHSSDQMVWNNSP